MTDQAGASRKHLVAGIVVLNLAGACLLWTLRDFVVSHDWRQTGGVVVAAQVQNMSMPTGVGFSGGACLVVEYRYTVDGASFAGDKYRSSGACLAPGKSARQRYRPGAPIPVWYDTGQPSVAVLDPTFAWDTAWMWGLFLVLIVMGNIELIGQARGARPPCTEPD